MKRTLVVHPYLFALFPILFVYAQNIEHLSLSQIWTSILVPLGFALIMLLLLTLILRSAARAGMLLSLFLILFFSYGFVYRILWAGGTDTPVSDSQILLIVWAVIFAGGAALASRIRRGLDDITKILNVMALVLVTISLANIGLYEFRTRIAQQDDGDVERVQIVQTRSVQADALPNIYYIILDGYARADILEELYNYDNSEFLEYLDQKGFFVADESQANYSQTTLSLTSSLNLSYLDDLASRVGPESGDRHPLQRMFRSNTVVQFLKQQGYVIVAFPSGYTPTTLDEADVYMGSGPPWNELEIALLVNTPIPWFVLSQSQFDPYAPHISRIRYTLEHLADTAQLESPHFVLAHVVAPHPPFVLDEHGNEIPQNRGFTIEDARHYIHFHLERAVFWRWEEPERSI